MDIREKKKVALLKAKKELGTWEALGVLCGVSQPIAYNWYHRNREVTPSRHVLTIEEATGVSRHDLRPDVFGENPSEVKS